MKRDLIAAGLGVTLVAAGVYLGATRPTTEPTTGPTWLLALAVLAGLVVGLRKVHGALEGPEGDAVPWAPGEPFASPSPELAEGDAPLSSDDLTRLVEAAGEHARRDGDVDAGLEAVRPALRIALLDALVAGGHRDAEVRELLADGAWTDDRLAASVLEESVDPPERSLRRRGWAWLFPERTVRRRVRRAVDALAEAAEESLPGVPGQTSPRTAPVVRPTLAELRRGVDGRLQRAVDPTVVARGPLPPSPLDDGDREDERP